MNEHNADTQCGLVAVIGAPNAGKSTLINALVGTKVTIVSPKVQTTRSIVRGIAMQDDTQIVFIDTPGIFSAKKRLERAMVAAAWDGQADADVTLLMVDVSRKQPDEETLAIIEALKKRRGPGPLVLVLNKIDKIPREKIMAATAALNEHLSFDATFMIAALTEDGTKDLMSWLVAQMPQGPHLFDAEQVSDMPMRLLAAEVTREKLFLNLHEELPYGLTVETENWEEFENGSIKIDQTIYIARNAHKPMILGKGGRSIKRIGAQARTELQEMLDCTVHLKLFVKVRENWVDDPERYRLWGLDPSA